MTCPVCPVQQEAIHTLAAENRELHKNARWHDLFTGTVQFARDNWPQSAYAAAGKIVAEAEELQGDQFDLTEAADVVITVCSWLNAAGHTADDLYAAVAEKMRVNRARAWARQADGAYQHVEVTT